MPPTDRSGLRYSSHSVSIPHPKRRPVLRAHLAPVIEARGGDICAAEPCALHRCCPAAVSNRVIFVKNGGPCPPLTLALIISNCWVRIPYRCPIRFKLRPLRPLRNRFEATEDAGEPLNGFLFLTPQHRRGWPSPVSPQKAGCSITPISAPWSLLVRCFHRRFCRRYPQARKSRHLDPCPASRSCRMNWPD